MAQTIKLKRSNTSGSKPTTSNLALGEIALNTKDGLFFLRRYVDGTDGNDTITAYTPEYLNEYDSQIDVTVTVDTKTAAHPEYGNGSSDGFLLDGLEGPFLVLTPGNTYRFDQSDSSNTGHPLRFYYESNKTTSFTTGVTTNGTAGSSGAYTQIAVTTSTPQVLYYQCSSHSLMGSGSFSIAGTIVEDQLAANSVTSAKIASNAVTSSEIAANAITSSEIAANAVGTSEIAANSITSAHISSGVVIEADVADNAITSAKIAENAVGSSEIAANAVGSSEIAANAVTTSEIAANAVTSSELATNSVTSSKIAANAITAREIAASGVSAASYGSSSAVPVITVDADGRITSATTAAISGLAANAVTATEIAANAVGSSEIAANAVGSSEIASNSVGIDELNVTDGTSGQVLTTDGAGTLSFTTVSGGGSQNLFSTIAVSGQSDIVADSTTDTLTIAAGSGITLGTNASTDTLTITATGGGLSANAVTSAYLASNAVLARHIAENAVGSSEIAANAVGSTQLASSGVSAGTYGSSTASPQITVDADGRITSVSNQTISSSGGGGYGFNQQVDVDEITGDGSTVTFDTGNTILSENNTMVFIDGVYQEKGTYSTSGSNITFSTAPPNGTSVEVMHFHQVTTGGGFAHNEFSGDGSTTGFTLSTTPQAETDLIVFIDGVYQNRDSFSTSGTTLTFDTAPANGTKVIAYTISGVITGKANIINNFSGDASTTDFTLSINPQHENNINVFIDGVYQQKSEFSVSGTTLSFTSAPPSGTDNIEVEINQITTTTQLAVNSVVSASIAANAVGSSEIAANAVGSSEIAANAIGVSELASGALNGQTFTGNVTFNNVTVTDEIIGDIDGAIQTPIRNTTGSTIYKGQAVYVTGLSGDTPTVALARANSASTMPAVGIVRANINNNATGQMTVLGTLDSIDTSGSNNIETGVTLNVNDVLYISATEAGKVTNTPPTGESNLIQNLGRAVRVSPNTNMTFSVQGAGRTNATPNLDDGDIFLGNASNQAVSASLNTKIEDYLDAGTSTPTFASFTMSNSTATAYDGTADQEGATVRIINTNNTTSDTFADIRFESHSTSTGRARLGMELPSVNNSDLFFVTENSGSLSEKMRITSNGNVGIGTNNPNNANLDLRKTGLSTGITNVLMNANFADGSNGTGLLIGYRTDETTAVLAPRTATGNLAFYNYDGAWSESMRIDNSGRVGIGTSSPFSSAKLQVRTGTNLNLAVQTGTTDTTGMKINAFNDPGNANIPLEINGSTLLLKTGETERMRIDSSGNVQVASGNLIKTKTDSGEVIRFERSADTNRYSSIHAYSTDQGNAYISFKVHDGVTATSQADVLHLKGNGNVGIGQTTPLNPLHIKQSNGTHLLALETAYAGADRSGRGQISWRDSGNITGGIWTEFDGTQVSMRFGNLYNSGYNTNTSMIIRGDGNVGIGQTSPYFRLQVEGANASNGDAKSTVLFFDTTSATTGTGGGIALGGYTNGTSGGIYHFGNIQGIKENSTAGDYASAMLFSTRANGATPEERMRIDSNGRLLVNRTTGGGYAGYINIEQTLGSGTFNIVTQVQSTVSQGHNQFVNPNGAVGSITTSGSATQYNTSSDYRLKENITYDFNALERVAQLKPARFNFIADADTTVDGFLAHEVQDIVPEAIHGVKDEVDNDGNPKYQGIDQSKLVPLLTKAIQEQQTIIDDLKARIETLENN